MTLPEEVRDHAYEMVNDVKNSTVGTSYKPLYDLYSSNEGGEAYFKTVCREYWRKAVGFAGK